ncbi:hypothetical protein K1719_026553 [Acacia pycnantha]|nr:hypothetical protein K1719_026553 [Acacia pycnantha]
MAPAMELVLLFIITLVSTLSAVAIQTHPLDPLTPAEFNLPDKQTILSWLSSKSKPKTQIPRRAFVVARFEKQSLEITVDLSTRSIASTKVYKGHGFPMMTFDEQSVASDLPFKYKPFIESVKKKGLDLSQVVCTTFSVGWFGQVKTNRILNIQCFYTNVTVNLYARPLEGITVVVDDLDEMKIVGYSDRMVAPVPKGEGTEYRASKLKPPFGPKLEGSAFWQPQGPGFEIHGHTIRLISSYLNHVLGFMFLKLVHCFLNLRLITLRITILNA